MREAEDGFVKENNNGYLDFMRDGQHGNFSGESFETQENRLWSYFDRYRTSGVDQAVARPDLASFQHVSEETKIQDQELLQKKMNKPSLRQQKPNGPDAFAFENFLTSEAMRQHWLGGELSPTSQYDDWISGVDAVAEWIDEAGKPVRLAIDFTSTNKTSVFWKKSDKLGGNIHVKYLRSRVETEQGKPKELRASIPLVILGVDDPVFRLIAESRDVITHEHPLRRLLVEQASEQIDLQLKLFVQNIFERSRAKRSKGTKDTYVRYLSLGKDFRVDQAMSFVHSLDQELLNVVMGEKDQQRFHALTRVKASLDVERATVQNISLDDKWKNILKKSITHHVLSS